MREPHESAMVVSWVSHERKRYQPLQHNERPPNIMIEKISKTLKRGVVLLIVVLRSVYFLKVQQLLVNTAIILLPRRDFRSRTRQSVFLGWHFQAESTASPGYACFVAVGTRDIILRSFFSFSMASSTHPCRARKKLNMTMIWYVANCQKLVSIQYQVSCKGVTSQQKGRGQALLYVDFSHKVYLITKNFRYASWYQRTSHRASSVEQKAPCKTESGPFYGAFNVSKHLPARPKSFWRGVCSIYLSGTPKNPKAPLDGFGLLLLAWGSQSKSLSFIN